MSNVNVGGLWDTLCDCLDSVREIEGLAEIAMEKSVNQSSPLNAQKRSSFVVTRHSFYSSDGMLPHDLREDCIDASYR